MQDIDLFFVIPTCRLREVGETVEQYDQHFWRNGYAVRIMVFDEISYFQKGRHGLPQLRVRNQKAGKHSETRRGNISKP